MIASGDVRRSDIGVARLVLDSIEIPRRRKQI